MENKRKIIIYAVFFLSVIYAGWFHFIRSQDAADKKNSAIMKSNIPNTGHSGAALLSDSGLSVDKIELAKTQPIPDGWGRDPFSDHSTSGASNNSRLSPASPGIPRLTAISYYDNDVSFAILDNKVVTEGDKIGSWTVLAIRDNIVVIRRPGQVENLTLGS